jgi:hypothetical protein
MSQSPSPPSNAGLHALETALYRGNHSALIPSLGQLRALIPRVDLNRPLPFGWRLRRNRDHPPVATLGLGDHLVVLGGEFVAFDDPDAEDVSPVFTPFVRDPVRQVDGQTRYDLDAFYRPDRDSWNVTAGVLWTNFSLRRLSGPYRISIKKSGDFAIACDTCKWKGYGKRSETVNLFRLLGDVGKHTCPSPRPTSDEPRSAS